MSQKMNKLLPAHIKRGTSKPGTCILDDRKKDKGGFGKICDFNIVSCFYLWNTLYKGNKFLEWRFRQIHDWIAIESC